MHALCGGGANANKPRATSAEGKVTKAKGSSTPLLCCACRCSCTRHSNCTITHPQVLHLAGHPHSGRLPAGLPRQRRLWLWCTRAVRSRVWLHSSCSSHKVSAALGRTAGSLVGLLVGWFVGWLGRWLVGWFVGWLVG